MENFWARFIEPSGQPGPNYWEYFAECLAQYAALKEGQTILDLGTYDGNVLFKAMQRIMGVGFGVGGDIYYGGFQDGAAQALRRGWDDRTAFVQTDANALAFGSRVFDTVLANFIGWDDVYDFERMEFICPDMMMAEIFRVLKPGGVACIATELILNQSNHPMYFTLDELEEYVLGATPMKLVDRPLDLRISRSLLLDPIDLDQERDFSVSPHIVLKNKGVIWTSVIVFLKKGARKAFLTLLDTP